MTSGECVMLFTVTLVAYKSSNCCETNFNLFCTQEACRSSGSQQSCFCPVRLRAEEIKSEGSYADRNLDNLNETAEPRFISLGVALVSEPVWGSDPILGQVNKLPRYFTYFLYDVQPPISQVPCANF